MSTTYTIQDELKELNSSLPSEKINFYSVPDGYFENLPATILSKIKQQEGSFEEELISIAPLLASIPRKMPYSIPRGYLESNPGLSVLTQNDYIPGIIEQAGKTMPYKVPAGYFQNFADSVLTKVKKTGARVIAFNGAKWMRYASAAIVTGIIIIGSVFYFKSNNSIDVTRQPHEWLAKKLKSVSNKELDDFIKTTDGSSQQVAKNTNDEVSTMVKDLPANELDEFLRQMPETDEASLFN